MLENEYGLNVKSKCSKMINLLLDRKNDDKSIKKNTQIQKRSHSKLETKANKCNTVKNLKTITFNKSDYNSTIETKQISTKYLATDSNENVFNTRNSIFSDNLKKEFTPAEIFLQWIL